MTWDEARAICEAGTPVRRRSWPVTRQSFRWLICQRGLFFEQQYFLNPTVPSGAPSIETATRFRAAEFLSDDWTTEPILTTLDPDPPSVRPEGDQTLPANDDGSTTEIPLPFSINYYGTTYHSLWVNNNGNLTFDGAMSAYTPTSLAALGRAVIAVFWADVDTRAPTSGKATYGNYNTDGDVFVATWPEVGYYSVAADKLNRFQIALVNQGGGDFDVELNYSKVEWETGNASGGSGGLGGSSARAGFAAASGGSVEIDGSGVNGGFLDSNPAGLIYRSHGSDIAGRFLYSFRGGLLQNP
ncbi:MAG: nidogen-like domain-containing protein [Chthoniobacterales bacterium]